MKSRTNSDADRLRDRAVAAGWLRAGETPWIRRLCYPLGAPPPHVREDNQTVRDIVLEQMLDGTARPRPLPCCLGGRDDVLLAEVDRYGFPLRTVLARDTGLIRTDPYYDGDYLVRFYRDHFRPLYTPANWDGATHTLRDIGKAEATYEMVHGRLPKNAKVLDCGCATGAMLVPWHLRGYPVWGCDYDRDWLAVGARLGLRLAHGSVESVAGSASFDLVLLRHVVQNLVDPVAFLKNIRSLISDDGLLYVETSGVMPIPVTYGVDVLTYFQNEHCWYFTKDTLLALLGRCGFEALSADEGVRCLAKKAEPRPDATCDVGRRVLALFRRNELLHSIFPKRWHGIVRRVQRRVRRMSHRLPGQS